MRKKKEIQEIFEMAKKAIAKNPIFFIGDLVAFLPCGKTSLYEYFPLDSNEMNELKYRINEKKIKTKVGIRGKLYKSEKAGELLALYRLICSDDERKMLNQNYIEVTGKGGKDLHPNIQVEIIDKREQVSHEDTDNEDL